MESDWYKNWFGNEYLTVYAHRDENEAQQLLDLIQQYVDLPTNAKILDLCCGQGRHALHLAEKGFDVVGMDLSRTLLEQAKFKNNPNQKAHFIQADMRQLPASRSFDLLLNLFTSFGYFQADSENLAVFKQFHQVLKRQAFYVFDYFHDRHVQENLVSFQRETFGKVKVEQERSIEKSRVQKKIKIEKSGQHLVFYESVKMYTPQQIVEMMEMSSLKVNQFLGDYQGNPFNTNSPRLIIIGQSG